MYQLKTKEIKDCCRGGSTHTDPIMFEVSISLSNSHGVNTCEDECRTPGTYHMIQRPTALLLTRSQTD